MMSKKKAHSTANPENSISQDEFVTLVESLCQNSVNGQTDIIFRMREVYAQYHAATKDKMFAYDTNVPAIPFAQVNTTDVGRCAQMVKISKRRHERKHRRHHSRTSDYGQIYGG